MAQLLTLTFMTGLVLIFCILLHNINEELTLFLGTISGLFFCIFAVLSLGDTIYNILTLLGV